MSLSRLRQSLFQPIFEQRAIRQVHSGQNIVQCFVTGRFFLLNGRHEWGINRRTVADLAPNRVVHNRQLQRYPIDHFFNVLVPQQRILYAWQRIWTIQRACFTLLLTAESSPARSPLHQLFDSRVLLQHFGQCLRSRARSPIAASKSNRPSLFFHRSRTSDISAVKVSAKLPLLYVR